MFISLPIAILVGATGIVAATAAVAAAFILGAELTARHGGKSLPSGPEQGATT